MYWQANKKWVYYFAALFLFVVLIFAAADFFLKKISPNTTPAAGESVKPPPASTPAAPNESAPVYKFTPPGTADPRAVIYTDRGFTPSELNIKSSDAIGCLITVVNRSKKNLEVRVNPHDPSGDSGVDYGRLEPGESGVYDVRYIGFSEMTLHNHLAPQDEFRVIYGQGCQ